MLRTDTEEEDGRCCLVGFKKIVFSSPLIENGVLKSHLKLHFQGQIFQRYHFTILLITHD